jgi:hypothetical protein
MGRQRWITLSGKTQTLTVWATTAGLRPQTLASRLARGLPLARALATGLVSREEAGRRGGQASYWSERTT